MYKGCRCSSRLSRSSQTCALNPNSWVSTDNRGLIRLPLTCHSYTRKTILMIREELYHLERSRKWDPWGFLIKESSSLSLLYTRYKSSNGSERSHACVLRLFRYLGLHCQKTFKLFQAPYELRTIIKYKKYDTVWYGTYYNMVLIGPRRFFGIWYDKGSKEKNLHTSWTFEREGWGGGTWDLMKVKEGI